MDNENTIELTLLMPCLNEEKTIVECIEDAKAFLAHHQIVGEVYVVDNGSIDSSVKLAREAGARVEICQDMGYGNALRFGLFHARGTYVIFADCDLSYDFMESEEIYKELKEGADFVVGNRFHPFPAKEAMSFSHRLGVPLLSWIGRIRYDVKVNDFHCGLRGIVGEQIPKLQLKASGMEFATEIIAKARRENLIISQVPITLRPDGRETQSHLRTVRDGLRHLRFMLRPLD